MGGGRRKTEKKAFSFGGSWSGGNVGGGGGNDNTSLNEGQDTVTNETYSPPDRSKEKEDERSNDNALQQAYLQTTQPVINTPAPVKPVVKPPEPKPEPKIQFMAPEPEPPKTAPNTGMTISSNVPGATGGKESPSVKISTYSGGETGPKETSNVYKDPNTGSTLATQEARQNIADGGDYNVLASTTPKSPIYTPTDAERPNMGFSQTGVANTGDVIKTGGGVDDPYAQEQERILTNTYNPRPSEDLATGDPLQYSSSTSTTAINPRINSAVRRALLDLGKAGGQLRRYFVR